MIALFIPLDRKRFQHARQHHLIDKSKRRDGTFSNTEFRYDPDRDEYACPRGKARKKVEMLFAHLKRILLLDRLRLRGPNGARDEFFLAATARNLRKLATLIPGAPAPV